MGLEHYRRRRDFNRTPEPAGEPRAKQRGRPRAEPARQFVVQKHAARRLHYDFRLELGGVLKSWAVPQGPSFDPEVKRLAVRTEDHPLEYAEFEGTIPEGEYGAGTVMVWDRGQWTPEGDAEAGLAKGHLRFQLEGEKLRGAWDLVRMGGRAAREDKENWLLVKVADDYAGEIDIAEAAPRSVVSARDLHAIADHAPSARGEPLPERLAPQLATLVEQAPEGEGWLHEIKYDGYRVLCHVDGGTAQVFTRNGHDWTERFPAIARALAALPLQNAWLDAELVVFQDDGTTNFQALQNAMRRGTPATLSLCVFDLLFLNGEDLRGQPLLARKRRLQSLLQGARLPLRYSDHLQGHGGAFLEQACRLGLEGIVSKRAQRPYVGRRTRDWLKIKCEHRQEFVVGGYTEPGGARKGFGALLLGVYEGERLRYAGRVGTGFDERRLQEVLARLQPLEVKAGPFDEAPPRIRQRVHWVRPVLVAEVSFTGWTAEGLLRHPVFRGLREDRPAGEVRRERAAPAPRSTGRPVRRGADQGQRVAGVALSNPDKVLYPGQDLSKRDLAQYYQAVADWLLPHAKDRPLTLVRCPEGQRKDCFYQKNATAGVSKALARVAIPHKGKTLEYLALRDLAGLIGLVQLGVLEIHVWGSRCDRVEHPDRLVFDLDPDEGLAWQDVVAAAQRVRARLADLGLESFLRTTGGKGLHVVVPLVRRHDWAEAKAFSKALAEDLVRLQPDKYTAKLAKRARKGKLFIDYLRNGWGATAVTSYSTRAWPGAPVAVPLAWEELSAKLHPDAFNVHTVPARLAGLARDPWADMGALRQSITKKMKRELGMKV
ncbi:DNA ligase D [Ectothiorhodospiraceae bacterium 2226]|nr:DNA ligase D [Ectothiorhodospiraceae bacterium 2226]